MKERAGESGRGSPFWPHLCAQSLAYGLGWTGIFPTKNRGAWATLAVFELFFFNQKKF